MTAHQARVRDDAHALAVPACVGAVQPFTAMRADHLLLFKQEFAARQFVAQHIEHDGRRAILGMRRLLLTGQQVARLEVRCIECGPLIDGDVACLVEPVREQ
ncbi:MAG: hypothetical protein MI924_25855 [Chloroflexales bacterium]|nr:hypothetical protein [Chloroflexales bacterium]